MTVTPAYGRDYKSKKEVLEAWNANKDFQIADMFHGGTYVNKQDVKPGETISFRYSRLTKQFILKVT